jgi:DNA primase
VRLRGWVIKPLSPALRKSLDKAATLYQEQLVNSETGLCYLNGRGLGPFEAETYRLGYVENPIEGHEAFKGMVSIPYLRPSGVIAMKFRRIGEGKPKYLNVAGCGTHLYNSEALRVPGRIVGLCEGEFDAVVLSGLVGIPSVAIPGATQWKGHPYWAALFEGKQVLIFADIDAGQEGNPGEKLAEEIQASLAEARIIRLPMPDSEDGNKMDVNRCFIRYGADEIRKRAGV